MGDLSTGESTDGGIGDRIYHTPHGEYVLGSAVHYTLYFLKWT
ncbi:hypothetical protein [Solemya velum gill symbiont]|nr:hypothetical protein [Solemya velum gill symbiont]